jgi:hypothetical protein
MLTKYILLGFIAFSFGCGASKQKTTTTAPPANSNMEIPSTKAFDYVPGEAELAAIKQNYSETTLIQLNTGYTIYSKGACIKCHESENIYKYNEESWKKIIDNMSKKAYLNPEQKDAVYKYVMSIKATQPAETK